MSIGSSTRGCFVQGGRPAGQKRVSLTTGPKGRPKEAQVEGPQLFGVVNEGRFRPAQSSTGSPFVRPSPHERQFCPAQSPTSRVFIHRIANKSRFCPRRRPRWMKGPLVSDWPKGPSEESAGRRPAAFRNRQQVAVLSTRIANKSRFYPVARLGWIKTRLVGDSPQRKARSNNPGTFPSLDGPCADDTRKYPRAALSRKA